MPAIRKFPEGYRKRVRKLVCRFWIPLQFRKVPEGSRKLVRKLTASMVLSRIRKVPEGLRKRDRKGSTKAFAASWHCKWRKYKRWRIAERPRLACQVEALVLRNYVSDFPEAFRKLFGSLPEAYTAFEARCPWVCDPCARLFTKQGFGIMFLLSSSLLCLTSLGGLSPSLAHQIWTQRFVPMRSWWWCAKLK